MSSAHSSGVSTDGVFAYPYSHIERSIADQSRASSRLPRSITRLMCHGAGRVHAVCTVVMTRRHVYDGRSAVRSHAHLAQAPHGDRPCGATRISRRPPTLLPEHASPLQKEGITWRGTAEAQANR